MMLALSMCWVCNSAVALRGSEMTLHLQGETLWVQKPVYRSTGYTHATGDRMEHKRPSPPLARGASATPALTVSACWTCPLVKPGEDRLRSVDAQDKCLCCLISLHHSPLWLCFHLPQARSLDHCWKKQHCLDV